MNEADPLVLSFSSNLSSTAKLYQVWTMLLLFFEMCVAYLMYQKVELTMLLFITTRTKFYFAERHKGR